jgi:hypothetical protein
MSDYNPDRWVVVEIETTKYKLYKVFACWYGGWAGSDSWKLNSGITSVTKQDGVYSFMGSSGSVYYCHENTYGTNMYGHGVLLNLIEQAGKQGVKITIMPEETNWMEINYV